MSLPLLKFSGGSVDDYAIWRSCSCWTRRRAFRGHRL